MMRNIGLFCALLCGLLMVILPTPSSAQVGIAITFGPPPLPIYEQPPCPAEGWMWMPGYWAYDYDYADYYWVPGTWVLIPEPGLFWTPPYWGWGGDRFIFYDGYWGPHVGFYGGVFYGFGYFGEGYEGGRWDHGQFYYNRSVNNVNVTNIHNVYNTTIINNTTINRVSYNGGEGGITARPTPEQEAAAHERHIVPTPAQIQHVQAARSTPALRASANLGKPPVAATAKPGAMRDGGVVAAKEAGGAYHPPAARGGTSATGPAHSAPSVPMHAKDLAPHPPTPPNTGDPKLDQKYQQQQEKLYQKQQQEHEKLAAQQEKDHQRLEQQKADDAKKQLSEQKHQQQTQQMEQKHTQQQQNLQQKQPPPRR